MDRLEFGPVASGNEAPVSNTMHGDVTHCVSLDRSLKPLWASISSPVKWAQAPTSWSIVVGLGELTRLSTWHSSRYPGDSVCPTYQVAPYGEPPGVKGDWETGRHIAEEMWSVLLEDKGLS